MDKNPKMTRDGDHLLVPPPGAAVNPTVEPAQGEDELRLRDRRDMARVWAEALIERLATLKDAERHQWSFARSEERGLVEMDPHDVEREFLRLWGRIFTAEQSVYTAACHLVAWQTRLERGSFAQDKQLANARNFFEHHDEKWDLGIEESKRSRATTGIADEALVDNARALLVNIDAQIVEELINNSLTDEHEH